MSFLGVLVSFVIVIRWFFIVRDFIISFIDRFYFLLKPFMPIKLYRYAVCGGFNLVLDSVLYFVFYHFVLGKEDVDLSIIVLSSHIAALFMVFPITVLTGFLLNKYITFQESNLSGRVQLSRYLLVVMGGLILSYGCMKLFVDVLEFFPTPSRILTIVIVVFYSFMLQSKYTFKLNLKA
ncbi:MAG: putative flippase GtrA [Roseivirga sp.]